MTEYSFSKRGEYFEGRFSTKAEAIKQALASYKDIETVYIGKVEEPVLTWNSNKDSITESMYEGLYDQCGEAAECFEVTEEQELALGKMIDEAVKAWIDKGAVISAFFLASRSALVRCFFPLASISAIGSLGLAMPSASSQKKFHLGSFCVKKGGLRSWRFRLKLSSHPLPLSFYSP